VSKHLFSGTLLKRFNTNKDTDYVTAVIGIFLILIGTYWLVYGKTFEGPVSRPHYEILTAPCLPPCQLQKFEVIMAQNVTDENSSAPGNDSSMGIDEKNGQVV